MKTITMLAIAAAILVTASTTSVLAKSQETQAQLQAEAKVTLAAAQKTALAKVPNGKIKSGELEREHGKLVVVRHLDAALQKHHRGAGGCEDWKDRGRGNRDAEGSGERKGGGQEREEVSTSLQ